MEPGTIRRPIAGLDDFIEVFETARSQDGDVDLGEFLPSPDHPLHDSVLRELVRVDLEYAWQRGRPRLLEEYTRRFPGLLADPEALQAITFEEYRLRRQAGEALSPADYQLRFGVSTDSWPEVGTEMANPVAAQPPIESAPRVERSLLQTRILATGEPPAGAASAYRRFLLANEEDSSANVDFQVRSDLSVVDDEGNAADTESAATHFPPAGSDFLGFHLVDELGQGAFGKVYLARQGELADRYVALKVSADLFDEPQTLAQLQHTNIVPVYSIHRARPFQAVCMPYFGSTTLSDVLKDLRGRQTLPESGKGLVSTLGACKSVTRKPQSSRSATSPALEAVEEPASDPHGEVVAVAAEVVPLNLKRLAGMTYVDALLWIFARLADGLAHAHERGILHRDLKPANILLAEDGQPMLLDFNLSEDVKVRAGTPALVGGTLLYMAPEHLAAFQGNQQAVDGRSDLYSLGIILYELLTGRRPFTPHRGALQRVLPQMIAERRQPPPPVRRFNRAVSPAVESIVRHCLEPDLRRRYQSARELHEDLERQQHHLPLRYAPEPSVGERLTKFARRHPRLASPFALAAAGLSVALMALIALGIQWLDAQRRTEQEAGASKLEEAQRADERRAADARDVLAQFRRERDEARFQIFSVFDTQPAVEQPTLGMRPTTAQLAPGLATARRALQRYQVLEQATAWQELPAVGHLSATDRAQLRHDVGDLLLVLGRAELLRAEEVKEPQRDVERTTALAEGRRLNELAEACFSGGPLPQPFWQQKEELARAQNQEAQARDFHTRGVKTVAETANDHYVVACDLALTGAYREAVTELKQALALDAKHPGALFLEARCHFELKQQDEAIRCYYSCQTLLPQSFRAYYSCGLMRIELRQWPLAVPDFDRAIRLLEDQGENTERPWLAEVYYRRGLARNWMGLYAAAVEDYTRALDLGSPRTRLFFLRAGARAVLRDRTGAEQDLSEFQRREPTDEDSWIERGQVRAQAAALVLGPSHTARLAAVGGCFLAPFAVEGAAGCLCRQALADFDKALELNPRSYLALQDKTSVLSEQLHETEAALAVLNQALTCYPDSIAVRSGRATLLARLGRRAEAQADARKCLQDTRRVEPVSYFQLGSVYALTSGEHPEDRIEAYRLLSLALVRGFGFEHIATDPDLEPLRGDRGFRVLAEAARLLRVTAVTGDPEKR